MKRYLSAALFLACAALGLSFFTPGKAQQPSQVGLVVQFLDGSIEKRCVEVEGAEIHGVDVLIKSGLAFVPEFNGSAGAAICQIEQDGCPADNCFCKMPNYWSYWHWLENEDGEWKWTYSPIGASNYVVLPGQVEAWRFGTGEAPDVIPVFEEICAPATPTPTATWTFTPSPPPPSPTPTATRVIVRNESVPSSQSTTIVISNPTAVLPTNTSTPIPSAVPPTQTPLPSPTAQVLAMQASTEAPAPTVLPTEPEAPTPEATATADSAGKKSAEVKKPTRTPDNLPAKRSGIALQGSGNFTAQTAQEPSSQVVVSDSEGQKSASVKKLVLMTGGIAGLLSFLAFFGVLSIGLAIVLVRKRR